MWRHHLVGGRRLLFIVGRVPVLLDPHSPLRLFYEGAASAAACQIYVERIADYRFGASEISALCDLRGFRVSMAVPEQILVGFGHAETRVSRPADMG
jgi:hypothetical protein